MGSLEMDLLEMNCLEMNCFEIDRLNMNFFYMDCSLCRNEMS